MEKRVIHEIRLSRPLMAVAIIAAIGLFAIGVKPFLSTPANAGGEVQQITLCNKTGEYCTGVTKGGYLKVLNLK